MMMDEGMKLVLFCVGVMAIVGTVVAVIQLKDAVADLERSTLKADGWAEVCYEYETLNRSKIVDPVKDGCEEFCIVDYVCWDAGRGFHMDCDEGRLMSKSCVDCLKATGPYIYTWAETSCLRKMLVKDELSMFVADSIMSGVE